MATKILDTFSLKIKSNLILTFSSSVILLLLGLSRTALLTKTLPIASFGIIVTLLNIFSFVSAFFSIRTGDLIYRYFLEFKEKGNEFEVAGLVVFCSFLSFIVNFLIFIIIYVNSSIISNYVIKGDSLTFLIKIFSFSLLINSEYAIIINLLRLKNHFKTFIISQIVGRVFVVFIIYYSFVILKHKDVIVVVQAELVGMFFSNFFPLIHVILIFKKKFFLLFRFETYKTIELNINRFLKTSFQTNLVGYFKLLFSPGDIFLLSVFSTSSEVAIYSLSQSLLSVFYALQNNIQSVLTPEIVKLWNEKKIEALRSFSTKYFIWTLLIGAVIYLNLIVFSKPIILLISKAEYLDALPIIKVLFFVVLFTISILIFYPIGLSADMVKLYNFANIFNVLILIVFLYSKIPKTAFSMSVFQLIATLNSRFIPNIFIAYFNIFRKTKDC